MMKKESGYQKTSQGSEIKRKEGKVKSGELKGYISVYITASSLKEANWIAKNLVEKRLVACANIIPKINSIYWWEGKICEDQEALIFVKTTKKLAKEVIREVKEIHSYDVPAIAVLEILKGNPDFLKWISQEVVKDEEIAEKEGEKG